MLGNKSNSLKLGAPTWWEIPAHQSRWVSYHFSLIENQMKTASTAYVHESKQEQKSHFAATWPDLAQ